MKKHYFVYILKCADDSYYTGVTNDIDRRFWEHNHDENKKSYTYKRRPVKIFHVEIFENIIQAIAREKQLKTWSRSKKEALKYRKFKKLTKLAKGKNGYLINKKM